MKKTIGFLCLLLAFSSCKDADYYKEKAMEYAKNKEYDKAISYLDKAIDKDSESVKAYVERGTMRFAIEDYELAVADFTKAVNIKMGNPYAYYFRGRAYTYLEEYEKALQDLNLSYKIMYRRENSVRFDFPGAFEYDVPSVDIAYDRASVYYQLDSLTQALHDFNYCLDKEAHIPEALYMRGLIYNKEGHVEKACNDFREAYSLGVNEALEQMKKYCN